MDGGGIISAWDPYTHFAGYTERPVAYGCEGRPPVDTGVVQRMAVDY
jgi:hypothetical protein